ncbi:tripartite tricarboxylate transporter substrate binding protein [Roseomonas sp. HJA6]|uniref:Tripartite tricarboxylate transporter substrate binding protein n=1 Tax=Roseomonas alba TaxID=2846776 RepID=A0ABS7A821_9PROT|nr:tripartite tricarboxylate transporter substrate binding protein [Neoroseomonas alba]MBW6397907.1 tripartite tricarboxylate transporter substrate binding protein [Neoroseomonas alba]
MSQPIGRRAAGGLGLAAFLARHAAAQPATWPERPVRLINSGAPGSGIDLIARLLAEGLAQHFGRPVSVENRPGGGSVLAVQAHAQARPGDSMLLAATGVASTVPYTFTGTLPYDPVADLVPVAIPASEFLCIAVTAELPVRSLGEFVALAKARPGAMNWNSVPGYVELDTRLFLHQQGIEATYIAYPGSPPAILDLAAGRIQMGVQPLTPLLGSVREGKVRALAVTSGVRAPSLPEVPTVAEAGFPGQSYDPFTGLFGWRGMPAAVRDRVAEAVRIVVEKPEVAARLRQAGILARYGSPADLAAVIGVQRDRVQLAVRTVGLRTGG